MNKQIRELAEQARKYAWENETHWSANAEREALFEEKFAELIVGECCQVLSKETIRHDGYGYNQHSLYQKIREHFGVKE
jgi:hypothetical protein